MTVHYKRAAAGNAASADFRGAGRIEPPLGDLNARAQRVAAIAAAHAEAVDRDGRFPEEAMAAARAERLMGVLIPKVLGGEGASLSEAAQVCYALGGACASTAMIYAMHQIKMACVVRHRGAGAWLESFLRRAAEGQMLLASSTTEGMGGGDVRSSESPVERMGSRIRLERAASVMSYGAQADAVVTTARRAADAAASDQVLVVFERADYTLERTFDWQTLGMRGTCSAGFILRAQGVADQVMATPYAEIHNQTMTPTAHLLWSSAWAGVAASAVERARLFIRRAARSTAGSPPPGAPYFVRASGSLRQLRALVDISLQRFEGLQFDKEALQSVDYQTEVTLLKVEASELAVSTVMSALRACGLSGYRTDGEASVARQLRDVLSAPLMINNERILADIGLAAVLAPTPTLLRETRQATSKTNGFQS